MEFQEYPKMLFKTGTALEWDGGTFDTLIVADAAECEAAIADGWCEGKPAEPAKRTRKGAE